MAMVALQVLSKILATSDNSIVEDNLLTKDYFIGFEEEFEFIQDHYKQYGNIPDEATFRAKFKDIELVEVAESDDYLVDTIREEFLYNQTVPIIKKASNLLKSDSNAAVEYLLTSMRDIQPSYDFEDVDIISSAKDRYNEYVERRDHKEEWFFTSGFPELDELMHGIQRTEELMVIFARTNQGKSWVLEKLCTHIWQIGYNVGYVSPEMGASSVGYRFDTLYEHFSNSGLTWGKDDVNDEEYLAYIEGLTDNEHRFRVIRPKGFGNRITVTKLRKWVENRHLDILAIDGITYLTDERYKKGDSKTTSLTNISEDLMQLSIDLNIPVLVVVQANRTGVVEKGSDETPELESIRDSDGIAHNASKVLSIHQKDKDILSVTVKKQRFGAVGGKLTYSWDINHGEFTFVPTFDDAEQPEVTRQKVDEVKKKYVDATDVF